MSALVALNAAASGANLVNRNYDQAMWYANAAALHGRLESIESELQVGNAINIEGVKAQWEHNEQFSRYSVMMHDAMSGLLHGVDALISQGKFQTELIVQQLTALVNIGDKLDEQTELLREGNRHTARQSETKSAEVFGKGMKCIAALAHMGKDEQLETIDRAIGYFQAAIEEDEFNEEASLQSGYWKSLRDPKDESRIADYRRAKNVALAELSNSDPTQVRIAEETLQALASVAARDLVSNGHAKIFLDEFAGLCSKRAGDKDRDHVALLTCAALIAENQPWSQIDPLCDEIIDRNGCFYLINNLLPIPGVVNSEAFARLLDKLCSSMARSEKKCLDFIKGIFDD